LELEAVDLGVIRRIGRGAASKRRGTGILSLHTQVTANDEVADGLVARQPLQFQDIGVLILTPLKTPKLMRTIVWSWLSGFQDGPRSGRRRSPPEYISTRPNHVASDYLLLAARRSRHGTYQSLTGFGVRQLNRTLAQLAGMRKRLYLDLFRHSLATWALSRGMNSVLLKDIIGQQPPHVRVCGRALMAAMEVVDRQSLRQT